MGFSIEHFHVDELQDCFIHALRLPDFSRLYKLFPKVIERDAWVFSEPSVLRRM